MDRQELIDNLGTVARSGTRAFMSKLAEAKDGTGLIGQFGVGFYSAFMVADRIAVTSRRAGSSETWVWTSTGGAGFDIAPASEDDAKRVTRGTEIVLHLKDDAKKYLEGHEIRRVVSTYSDHILFPIELVEAPEKKEGEEPAEAKPEKINSASALWQRPKTELKPEDYTQAYHTIAHAFDEPALTIHYKAEGRYSYAVLLFAPSERPFDLFDPARKGRVKLYVRRVYITDDADLLPSWLRFIRGVVDSEDLPLNISREMLQNNPQVGAIRRALTGRVISELETLAEKDAEKFGKIWEAFGAVLKEGIYEDHERREALLKLARFDTTTGKARTLKQYVADLKPNQTEIYYLVGDSAERLKSNPKLEAARARGIEVLLLSDPVDAFWTMMPSDFEGKPLKSLSKGEVDFNLVPPLEDEKKDEAKPDAAGESRRSGRARRREVRARRTRQRREGVIALGRQPGLSRRLEVGARSRNRAADGAPEPRRRREADPRTEHEARAGEGDRQRAEGRARRGRERPLLAAVLAGANPRRRGAGRSGGVRGAAQPAGGAGAWCDGLIRPRVLPPARSQRSRCKSRPARPVRQSAMSAARCPARR